MVKVLTGRRLRLHQRHHGGGIHPARKERAQRHISNHLQADGVFSKASSAETAAESLPLKRIARPAIACFPLQ